MNVEEVERLGKQLQGTYAAEIRRFMSEIEKLVNNTNGIWIGKDGNDFRSWWPAKRNALRAIAEDLHGFGQSALNNASEQRTVSDR
jgi:uncharacterized protein YukE